MTDSKIVRGIVTAYTWMIKEDFMKAFSSDKLEDGLKWAGADIKRLLEINIELNKLREIVHSFAD